jgi:hypothetical protein
MSPSSPTATIASVFFQSFALITESKISSNLSSYIRCKFFVQLKPKLPESEALDSVRLVALINLKYCPINYFKISSIAEYGFVFFSAISCANLSNFSLVPFRFKTSASSFSCKSSKSRHLAIAFLRSRFSPFF